MPELGSEGSSEVGRGVATWVNVSAAKYCSADNIRYLASPSMTVNEDGSTPEKSSISPSEAMPTSSVPR